MHILLLLVGGGGKEFRFLGERSSVLAPKSAILVTFYPKLCKFLQFSPKFAQIWTFFPKICSNFDIFSKNLCKFWQFLPKILQILTIFTKKRGETFSKNFRMWGKNKILWQNIHLWLDLIETCTEASDVSYSYQECACHLRATMHSVPEWVFK